jgi:hypothetical protein
MCPVLVCLQLVAPQKPSRLAPAKNRTQNPRRNTSKSPPAAGEGVPVVCPVQVCLQPVDHIILSRLDHFQKRTLNPRHNTSKSSPAAGEGVPVFCPLQGYLGPVAPCQPSKLNPVLEQQSQPKTCRSALQTQAQPSSINKNITPPAARERVPVVCPVQVSLGPVAPEDWAHRLPAAMCSRRSNAHSTTRQQAACWL